MLRKTVDHKHLLIGLGVAFVLIYVAISLLVT